MDLLWLPQWTLNQQVDVFNFKTQISAQRDKESLKNWVFGEFSPMEDAPPILRTCCSKTNDLFWLTAWLVLEINRTPKLSVGLLAIIVERTIKISKMVKILVRSCFLVTLIKCLKGHRSLGSLFNVKNQKWLSQSVTQWVSDNATYWAVHRLCLDS